MNTFFIRFHLLSPMQIGAGSLGMIEKTLLYIPPKVIWGAFVNRLTQMIFQNPDGNHFIQVGNAVDVGGISTFFPEIDGVRMLPVIPDRKWIDPEHPEFCLSFSEIQSSMMTSMASTAIAPEQMAAARGTLHAVDLINSCAADRSGNMIPVSFSGYMSLSDNILESEIDDSLIRKVFDSSRIGGGRKCGLGRIMTDTVELVSGYDGFRQIPIPGGTLLTADMPFSPELNVSGEIRLISRREYDPSAGSGQHFSDPQFVWATGSVIYDSAS